MRHTAPQVLREEGVDEVNIAATVGHEHKTMTRRYGDGYSLARLKDIIEKLDYDIELTHISFKKFEDYRVRLGWPIKNKHLLYVSSKR